MGQAADGVQKSRSICNNVVSLHIRAPIQGLPPLTIEHHNLTSIIQHGLELWPKYQQPLSLVMVRF